MNARGRGREGVESSSMRGTRCERSIAAARDGVVSVHPPSSVSYSSIGTALTEAVDVVEIAGEGNGEFATERGDGRGRGITSSS